MLPLLKLVSDRREYKLNDVVDTLGAKKGVFVTTSSFTKEAIDYKPCNETKIVLIDGEQLAQLMIDYNLGVTAQQTYEIKRMDNDYFGE